MNLHPPQSPSKIFSVSKLSQEIKFLLEEKYDIVWISGEITNLRIATSGHAYFTLKDEKAQIAAVMFKGQLRQLKFDLENGATIVAMGRISVYEPRGTYQIILEYVEPKGIGALQIAFEQLKKKLADEGLFDTANKQAIPFLPHKIAVITSPTGAAVQDILNVTRRRFYNMPVDIYPVHVQGNTAASEIAKALILANERADADVLILARGGGSMEDLAPFNSETVARAIFSSAIPVISAVGHETDFTIADFVADLRAPTPSAAAEMAVPVKAELVSRCKELQFRCHRSMVMTIGEFNKQILQLSRRLVHPKKKIQEWRIRLDDLQQRLSRSIMHQYNWKARHLSGSIKLMLKLSPGESIAKYKADLNIIDYKLLKIKQLIIEDARQKIRSCEAALNALNPLAVLKRGYSITRALPHRMIITHADAVAPQQPLEIVLHQGVLEATVTDIKKKE